MRTDMKSEKNDTYINDKKMQKKNAKQTPKKCKKMTRQIQNDKPKCKKNDKIIILEFPMFAGPRFS